MRSRWLGYLVAVLALAVSLWAFPRLPPMVPSHWNLHGEVNGYGPRWAVALVLPVCLLGLRVLFGWLPRIDPLGRNYEGFADTYWLIVNSLLVFSGVLHVIVLANGLGFPIHLVRLIPVGIGLLLMFLGNVLGRVRPNWFVGIRTPWTLSSETVWRKTHRTAAWVFVLGGVAVAATALLPQGVGRPLLLLTILVLVLVPIVQSYVLWKGEQRDPPR